MVLVFIQKNLSVIYHTQMPGIMVNMTIWKFISAEVEAMKPIWIDFHPNQAFAPSHCDAWAECAVHQMEDQAPTRGEWPLQQPGYQSAQRT